jgi:casein kinase II subunit alpha
LAQLIFQKQPFFSGKSLVDQLVKITKVLGTKKLNEYTEAYNITINSSMKDMIGKSSDSKTWDSFKNNKNAHLFSEESIDLIHQMLQYDHKNRITAREAINHPFLSS